MVDTVSKAIDLTHFLRGGFKQKNLFQHKMLTKPNFDYVVKYIKLPLQKAMESRKIIPILIYAFLFALRIQRRIGKVTKENTIFVSTHNLIDEKEWFFSHHHNPHNDPMFKTIYDIAVAVTGHDPYYEYLYREHCWQIVGLYKAGKLPELDEPPEELKKCWNVGGKIKW